MAVCKAQQPARPNSVASSHGQLTNSHRLLPAVAVCGSCQGEVLLSRMGPNCWSKAQAQRS